MCALRVNEDLDPSSSDESDNASDNETEDDESN